MGRGRGGVLALLRVRRRPPDAAAAAAAAAAGPLARMPARGVFVSVVVSRLMNALIDLTFSTVTNDRDSEIREAAPRLRLVGAFPPRKHTTVAFTP
jgi:hypothetical protein